MRSLLLPNPSRRTPKPPRRKGAASLQALLSRFAVAHGVIPAAGQRRVYETTYSGIGASVLNRSGAASGGAVRCKGRGEEGGRGDQGSGQGRRRRSQARWESDGKGRQEG